MPERSRNGGLPLPKPGSATGVRRASGVLRIDARAEAAAQGLDAGAVRAAPARDAGIELRLRPAAATLLISTRTEQEVLAPLLAALAGTGAHLQRCDQHGDPDSGACFYRLALDVSAPGCAAVLERRVASLSARLGLPCAVQRRERRAQLALFVSKYDHCLIDLLQRQRTGELDCEIPLIVSNHPDLQPLAQQFGVDYELIRKSGGAKQQSEAHECALLAQRGVELVVLARYMQILSDEFIARCPAPVINIHHSFLPAFIGAKPYHQARQRGVKLIGATAHYATAQLDEGPIIEQDVVRCTHRDGVEELVRKGRDLERLVLSRAVRWHLEDRVVIHGNRTVVFE